MYKKDDGQITLAEFNSPFGKLDRTNRWAKIADMIPWQRYETKYAERFCDNNGAPAIQFRMAMGTLIIKQRTGHSDEDVLQDILENPYMQYLIGLHEFTMEPPFSSASITNFRKYITKEMINEINEEIFKSDNSGSGGNDANRNDGGGGDITIHITGKAGSSENHGTLMLDATCVPANITYPTDVNLLNEAREKLEGIIDRLHWHTGDKRKPRTYRNEARKRYLTFIKNRKPRKEAIRKTIGQQLRYVARNLRHIDKQLQKSGLDVLNRNQQNWLKTIQELHRQQQRMYETRTHSVERRIVSINQPGCMGEQNAKHSTSPHVRPIVRGKTNAPVEFGAKVSISLVDGYIYMEKLDWEAYNEAETLIPSIEKYKERNGLYPEAVLADKIHRNRENLRYCKERGIRLSGPRLGRPPKETDPDIVNQTRKDASKRNAIEGKFGEGKTKYGLDRIMARLMGSSETVIAMSLLCMNISRRLRVLLLRLFRATELMFWHLKSSRIFIYGVFE